MKYIGDRQFYKRVLALLIPILVQTGITNFVNMLDNLMIGRTGSSEIAGVAVGNQLLFVLNLCVFGMVSGAGILGAGLLASTIYDATHPRPYVAPAPVVVTPAPVVVAPQPQVIVQTPAPVVQTGHYETRVQNVWVEGRYIDQTTPQGGVVRTWQPGHYEQQQTQVWVNP